MNINNKNFIDNFMFSIQKFFNPIREDMSGLDKMNSNRNNDLKALRQVASEDPHATQASLSTTITSNKLVKRVTDKVGEKLTSENAIAENKKQADIADKNATFFENIGRLITNFINSLDGKIRDIQNNRDVIHNWAQGQNFEKYTTEKVKNIAVYVDKQDRGVHGFSFTYNSGRSKSDYGDINAYSRVENISLDAENKFLVAVELKYNSDTNDPRFEYVKFEYSSGHPPRLLPLPKPNSQRRTNEPTKKFYISKNAGWYYNHLAYAARNNYNLACPKDDNENAAIRKLLSDEGIDRAFIGVIRKFYYPYYSLTFRHNKDPLPGFSFFGDHGEKCRSTFLEFNRRHTNWWDKSVNIDRTAKEWKNIDGTPFNYQKWSGGEPNNSGVGDPPHWWFDKNTGRYRNMNQGEPVTEILSNGKWNDIGTQYQRYAVYQEKISATKVLRAEARARKHIYALSRYSKSGLTGEYRPMFEVDFALKNATENVIETADKVGGNIGDLKVDMQNINYKANDLRQASESTAKQTKDLVNLGKEFNGMGEELNKEYDNAAADIQKLKDGEKTTMTTGRGSMAGGLAAARKEGKIGFTNLREGMSTFTQAVNRTFQNANQKISNLQQNLDEYTNQEYINYMTELLSKRDNMLNNVLFDYMINEEDNTNISKVYKKLDQDTIDKKRVVDINTYYTKTNKEYVDIIKFIILVTIIIIPIVILNSNYIIPKNITMFLIITILIVAAFYILYKFYDISMRDNKNFDKIIIPYDPNADNADNKSTGKGNLNTSLFGTCIGDACCDASMVYDNLRNICVLQENFGDYFDNKENFIGGKSVVEEFRPELDKTRLCSISFNYSSKDRMFEPNQYNNPRL